MRKSFICIFLVIAFVFTLSFSVYADLPVDDFPSKVYVKDIFFSLSSTSSTFTYPGRLYLNTGTIYSFIINHENDSLVQFGYSIDIELNRPVQCDVYFFSYFPNSSLNSSLYPINYTNTDTGVVLSRSQLADMTSYSSFNYSGVSYNFVGSLTFDNKISFSSSTGSFSNQDLQFGKISNLPSGGGVLSLQCSYHSSPDVSFFPFGIFIDYHDTGDPVLDFEYGFIDFNYANNQVISDMDSVLNSESSSDFEKQFAVSIADQQLLRIQAVSDAKYSGIVNSFSDKSSDIVQSFVDSGSIDILPSVTQLNTLFSDSLTQSVTPEQGTLINSLYNVRLSEMQAIFDVNYNQYLESIITDSDFENSDSYREDLSNAIAVQSEALLIFEESDYQAYLNFESWIADYLSDQNYHPIKDIYDFIFSDPSTSDVQPFLIIPFSLVLLSALLGTVITVSRGKKHG